MPPAMTNKELIERSQKVLFQNYRTQPVALVRGEGTQVWDADGKRYLDFIGGIATVSVGHANAQVRNAVLEQTKLLWHASNLYFTEPQVRLAEKLTRLCFADRVFFCNSGTEANEAMIKLARRWHVDSGHPERIEIVCMHESFHGRTMGSLAATGRAAGERPAREGLHARDPRQHFRRKSRGDCRRLRRGGSARRWASRPRPTRLGSAAVAPRGAAAGDAARRRRARAGPVARRPA